MSFNIGYNNDYWLYIYITSRDKYKKSLNMLTLYTPTCIFS